MSENKDLEIIEEELKWLESEIAEPYTAFAKIGLAAERMAAEIERLETADVLSDEVAFKNTKYIEELEAEITQLKAELEKRPEVLYCKDCRSIQHEYSQDEDGRIIAELLVCGMSGRPIGELDFCSYGQRRESEEK